MGENQRQVFQLSFNRSLRVGLQGSKVTSNGGLILVRELDERRGFGELIDEHLTDSRASNARFSLADLLRQSVYSRLAGYEDVNDEEFSGVMEGLLAAGVTAWRKNVLASTQVGVYFQSPEGQIVNSGFRLNCAGSRTSQPCA